MGKTAFDGPVYGAKETLFSFVLTGDRTSGGEDGLAGTEYCAMIHADSVFPFPWIE